METEEFEEYQCMWRSVSTEEFEEYQRLSEAPVKDGDVEGQRRKMNAIYWVAYCHINRTGGQTRNRERGINILEQVVREQDNIARDNVHDMTGKHRCVLATKAEEHQRIAHLFRQAVPRLQYEAQVDGGGEFGETALHLGACFCWGMGVEKNTQKGTYWWTRAVERGSKEARLQIYFFCNHMVSPKNEERENITDFLHQLATEQEEPWAQRLLGNSYKSGNFVEKDLVKAVEWYNKAIAQGDLEAPDIKRALLDSLETEERNRVLGCVKRNENIEKARDLTPPSTYQVPLGLWPLAIGVFQQQMYPPWEAPSPTYLSLCAVVPKIQKSSNNQETHSEEQQL